MKPILRKIDTGMNSSFSIREDIQPFLYNHLHYHPELELTYIRKGKGTRLVKDNIDRFDDGDLILLGANVPHVWRSDSIYFEQLPGVGIEAIAIHFKEDFWGEQFLCLPELKNVRDLFIQSERGLKITGRTKNVVISIMESMLCGSEIERILGLLNILNTISSTREYRALSGTRFSSSYALPNLDRINSIYNYTFDNFQNPIKIKEVAAVANLSPNSFCKYFKTRTSKTYFEFLMEVRIGYACKLLVEQESSVGQVCFECGFNNLSNFNRYFKAMVKLTPLQYAKTYTRASA
jgi:AraC-like DNA-binding protein